MAGDRVAQFFAKAAEAVSEVSQGAMTDIRQKLVEEPWFGRAVTGEPEPSMSEKLGWTEPGQGTKAKAWDALCDRLAKERGHQPEPDPAHDHDIAR